MPIAHGQTSLFSVQTITINTDPEFPDLVELILTAEDGDQVRITVWGDESVPELIDTRPLRITSQAEADRYAAALDAWNTTFPAETTVEDRVNAKMRALANSLTRVAVHDAEGESDP